MVKYFRITIIIITLHISLSNIVRRKKNYLGNIFELLQCTYKL